jgi:hypothetical protein
MVIGIAVLIMDIVNYYRLGKYQHKKKAGD